MADLDVMKAAAWANHADRARALAFTARDVAGRHAQRAGEIAARVEQLLGRFHIPFRWSGVTGTRLDLIGADGQWVEGPDLGAYVVEVMETIRDETIQDNDETQDAAAASAEAAATALAAANLALTAIETLAAEFNASTYYSKVASDARFATIAQGAKADSAVQPADLTTALASKSDLASPIFTGTPEAPTAAASTNTTQIATTAMVQAAIAAYVAAQDAMVFKSVIDASANPNYPAADAGHTYRISVAGKIGGGSGVNVEAGDILLCLTDSTASGDQATVGSSWSIIQVNIDGAVTLTGTQTLTNKTLTSPDLAGTPTATTPSAGNNSTRVATTAFVQTELASASSPIVLLNSFNITPGASLIDLISGFSSLYDEYEIHLNKLKFQSTSRLSLKISNNAGAAWLGNNYYYSGHALAFSSTTPTGFNGSNTTQAELTRPSVTNTAFVSMIIRIQKPGDAAYFSANWAGHQNDLSQADNFFGHMMHAGTTAVNGIRLASESNGFTSGGVKFFGIRT